MNKRIKSELSIIVLTCNIIKITIKKIRYKKINKRVAKIQRKMSKIELVIVIKKIKKIDCINMLKDRYN